MDPAAGNPGKAVCHSRHAETGKGETLEGKKKGHGQDWMADWKPENVLIEADSIKSVCLCGKLGYPFFQTGLVSASLKSTHH